MVCHHPHKFGDHGHCESRDVFNLSCDLNLITFLKSYMFIGGSLQVVSHHLARLVAIGCVQVEI